MRCSFRLGCATLILALAVPGLRANDAAARQVRAHTTFLADDLLEGRGTGTRGYSLAAKYVASQFARMGLEPGADGGSYEQSVKFIEATRKLEAGRLVIRYAGREDALAPVTDMLAGPSLGQTTANVSAPAAFVGFGVQAPGQNYDDFAGVDLKGKIAVVLFGAPARFPSTQRAQYSSLDLKSRMVVERGAVGLVVVLPPSVEARFPWAFAVANSRFPAMRLLGADGSVIDGFPQLQAGAFVRRAAAARVFAASGRTGEAVFAKAEAGEAQAFVPTRRSRALRLHSLAHQLPPRLVPAPPGWGGARGSGAHNRFL